VQSLGPFFRDPSLSRDALPGSVLAAAGNRGGLYPSNLGIDPGWVKRCYATSWGSAIFSSDLQTQPGAWRGQTRLSVSLFHVLGKFGTVLGVSHQSMKT